MHGEAFEPAVVRTYFRATCDGAPYAELDSSHFVISENGEALEQTQSNQSFVFDNFGRAYANVLLVDVSNTMLESDVFANFQSAAIEMFEDIAHGQYWAVYAFDGSESLTEVVAFSSDQLELNASVSSMAELEVTETTTNLNGAILLGLDELNGWTADMTEKIIVGNVVVLTDGDDQAGFTSDEETISAVTASNYGVFSIGLGPDVDTAHLTSIGKSGSYFPSDSSELYDNFDEIGTHINDYSEGLYVLAYCSQQTKGNHEATFDLTDEDASVLASMSMDFSAEGFQTECNPSHFDTVVDDPEDNGGPSTPDTGTWDTGTSSTDTGVDSSIDTGAGDTAIADTGSP